jgi:NAD(P)-dependent dehydrogenase (short-subunit alcohol dehydrogenase family)
MPVRTLIENAVARPVSECRVAADVSAAEGLRCLVKAVTNAEILVNNAGIFEPNFQISPTKIECGSSIPT